MNAPDSLLPPAEDVSWGGAGVALLAGSVMAYAALGKIVDRNLQIEDASGRSILYEGGSVGTYAALLMLVVGAGCAVVGFVTGRVSRLVGSAFTVLMSLCLLWWLVGTALWRRGDLSALELVLVPLGMLIAAGTVVDPPNRGTLRFLNLLRDVGVVGAIGVSLLMPQVGTVPCRPDKCGAFGSMWTGYFMHENTATGAFLVLLPLAVLYRMTWQRILAAALVAVMVLGSGSRTALLALIVVGGFLLAHGLLARLGLPLVMTVWPITAYVVSTAFLFGLVPLNLTGRGWIYDAIVNSLSGYPALFGPGAPELIRQTGGWIVGEHGQAPHVLLQLGWAGFFMFALALISLIRFTGSRQPEHVLGLAMVVIPAARFVTEPALIFQTRTMEFVAICLAMGFLASPNRLARRSNESRELTDLRRAVASLSIIRLDRPGDRSARPAHQVDDELHVADQGALRNNQDHSAADLERSGELRGQDAG